MTPFAPPLRGDTSKITSHDREGFAHAESSAQPYLNEES